MAEIVKRRRYENRQPGYTDAFVIAYRREDDGTFTVWAEERPPDPYRDPHESHVVNDAGKLCVACGREPRSLERAEAIAHAWMLGYSQYVRSGRAPRGARRVDV